MALNLNDKSPNGYNLTNHGATEYTTDHPFSASLEAAALVQASSQYLSADGTGTLEFTSFTAEAWVKLTSNNVVQDIMSKYDALTTDKEAFEFYILTSGKLGLNVADQGASVGGNTVIATNTWTHVAVTWDDNNHGIYYVNGVADGM